MVIEQTIAKKNPCIVGIDPMWQCLPQVYTRMGNPTEGLYVWELWSAHPGGFCTVEKRNRAFPAESTKTP